MKDVCENHMSPRGVRRIGSHIIVRVYQMTYSTFAVLNSGLDASAGPEEEKWAMVVFRCLVQLVTRKVINRIEIDDDVAEF